MSPTRAWADNRRSDIRHACAELIESSIMDAVTKILFKHSQFAQRECEGREIARLDPNLIKQEHDGSTCLQARMDTTAWTPSRGSAGSTTTSSRSCKDPASIKVEIFPGLDPSFQNYKIATLGNSKINGCCNTLLALQCRRSSDISDRMWSVTLGSDIRCEPWMDMTRGFRMWPVALGCDPWH